MSIATVTLVDKCRVSHDGRKEVNLYIFEAPDKQSIEGWVKENVFFMPRILRLYKGERYWVAEIQEWVD